jgi:hypothetical protein
MTDQLSLPLDETADRLPDLPDLRPMLARPLPDAFDSEQHLFEPWWGGTRALVSIGPADRPGDGGVRIVDADEVDRRALEGRLAGEVGRPVAFLAFDLLHLDGMSLLGQPLLKRREALKRILRPGDEVVAVPAIATEGRALFDAIVAQGLAGMMARQRQGPYLPGVRSRLWRLIPAVEGAIPDADLVDAPAEASATAPVLALLSRLPLEDGA